MRSGPWQPVPELLPETALQHLRQTGAGKGEHGSLLALTVLNSSGHRHKCKNLWLYSVGRPSYTGALTSSTRSRKNVPELTEILTHLWHTPSARESLKGWKTMNQNGQEWRKQSRPVEIDVGTTQYKTKTWAALWMAVLTEDLMELYLYNTTVCITPQTPLLFLFCLFCFLILV